jgi:sulfate permease, SulP family
VLLFLRPVLALFPKAALGAIVIYAATKLIEIPEFIRLYRFRRNEFLLALLSLQVDHIYPTLHNAIAAFAQRK